MQVVNSWGHSAGWYVWAGDCGPVFVRMPGSSGARICGGLVQGKGRFLRGFRPGDSRGRFCVVPTGLRGFLTPILCGRLTGRLNRDLRIWTIAPMFRDMYGGRRFWPAPLPRLLLRRGKGSLPPSFEPPGRGFPCKRPFHGPLALFHHIISRLQGPLAHHVNGVLLRTINLLILLVPYL